MSLIISVELAVNLVSYDDQVRLKAEQTIRAMLAIKAPFSETRSRKDFEVMAAINYPGALALGRHSIHRNYKNANLEKRWKGWLLCDQYRNGIKPEEKV